MAQGHRPPDGEARRSQLLMGAGPGALIDLVEDAVIVGGLESWRYRRETDGFIIEPRLQDKAQAKLADMPWWGHRDVRLRLPPECESDQASPVVGIGVGRFPRWFTCQNPECRSIVPLKALDKPSMHKHTCRETERKSFPVVPMRFVAACARGHIQDIDWLWFVHQQRRGEELGGRRSWCTRTPGANRPQDPLGEDYHHPLYMLQVGTTGDLSDYVVGCRDCGAQRGLQSLAQRDVLGTCAGARPWLGFQAREVGCTESLKLQTRTASGVYSSVTISVLSIPDPALRLREQVERVWDFVRAATPVTLPVFRQLPMVDQALGDLPDSDVMAEIERRRQGLPVIEAGIREMEWRALMAAEDESPTVHPGPQERWFAQRLVAPMPPFVDRVVLVKHLTEVRAQLGFTRIQSTIGDAECEYTLDPRTAPLARYADWLPAVEILGEGVFLALHGPTLDAWANAAPGSAVARRATQFARGFIRLNESRAEPLSFPGTRLVMLHTLSHLLINSISLECGYAASSIRERLYCHSEPGPGGQEQTVRAGILLYTGSPGSEGTLGGLVEVGRNIAHHLRRAAEMALLCSNDPVCAQHSPDDDQEGRHREGAACHGCVLIGEPSCERMNQDLDRALVVPTVGADPAMAFLAGWIAAWDGAPGA